MFEFKLRLETARVTAIRCSHHTFGDQKRGVLERKHDEFFGSSGESDKSSVERFTLAVRGKEKQSGLPRVQI